jgi:hypothetical protein
MNTRQFIHNRRPEDFIAEALVKYEVNCRKTPSLQKRWGLGSVVQRAPVMTFIFLSSDGHKIAVGQEGAIQINAGRIQE